VRRTDPGDPNLCPVYSFHQIYSNEATRDWVQQGCRSASFGCLECKQPVVDAVLAELQPMRVKAQAYLDDPTLVRNVIADGCERARKLASDTLRDVRESVGLAYS
ncbi:MAG: tryptophan--tRNA ligase, partial [Burkholderiales bacterium]